MSRYAAAKAKLFDMPGLAGRGAQPRRRARRRTRAAPWRLAPHHRLQPVAADAGGRRRVHLRKVTDRPRLLLGPGEPAHPGARALQCGECPWRARLPGGKWNLFRRRCKAACDTAARDRAHAGRRRRAAGGDRLRAHARCAAERAAGAASGRRGTRRAPRGGVRRRWRPRPHQASADGRNRRASRRPGADHLRQPAQRRPDLDHPEHPAGCAEL